MEQQIKKTQYRKIYKNQLIEYFVKNNITYSDDIIKSILSKVAIHSRNKYGETSFEDELFECGIDNGICFYSEYNMKNTFNKQNM
jgi:hypothetical protein